MKGFVHALEHKDVLAVLFSVLPISDLGCCARVSAAWRKASLSEWTWQRRCEREEIARVEGESFLVSFQLSSPAWRAWTMHRVQRDLELLARVPLKCLVDELETEYEYLHEEPAAGQKLGVPLAKAALLRLESVIGSAERAAHRRLYDDDSGVALMSAVHVHILEDTGLVPSWKGTSKAEIRFRLNEYEIVHKICLHDQDKCPCILYCLRLSSDDAIPMDEGQAITFEVTETEPAFNLILRDAWNDEVNEDNVRELMRVLGLDEARMELPAFMSAIARIGSGYLNIAFDQT